MCHSLQAGKFKLKVLTGSVSDEDSFPGSQKAVFSLCPVTEGMRKLSGVPFMKVLIPVMKAPPS